MLDIAQSPVEKPSVRAPLLWILVPQILGYAAALNWELSPVICLLSGTALSLKALGSVEIRLTTNSIGRYAYQVL